VKKQGVIQPLGVEHFKNRARNLESGVDTHFRSGDRRLVLPSGGLTVIAGSPSEGKTSLMLNLLRNLLRSYPDKKFYFFSYEEPDIFLALKLLMISSNVQLNKDNFHAFIGHFKTASWRSSDEKEPQLAQALDEFNAWTQEGRLCLLNPELDCFALVKEIRENCAPETTGAIFIDYIQKIRLVGGPYARDRYQQLQMISDELRKLSIELGAPIVVGAQLNRSVRAWPPSLDHIRESADIGQDATLVLALKRERRAHEELEKLKVHVCKDRRGRAHYDLTFSFRGATYRIDSLTSTETKAFAKQETSTVVEGGVWLPLDAKADDTFVQWG